MTKPLFILASSSPRRRALLESIGLVPDKVVASAIDETPAPKELPRHLALRLAREKMQAVVTKESAGIVLAADTVVSCGRRLLPKAETNEEVRNCLKFLSGRRHHVFTAVAVHFPKGRILERIADSTVTFRLLSKDDIETYVKTGEGIGKAGGYAIQGYAAAYIRFISGSYSNIVGLPLFEVAQMLKDMGQQKDREGSR